MSTIKVSYNNKNFIIGNKIISYLCSRVDDIERVSNCTITSNEKILKM